MTRPANALRAKHALERLVAELGGGPVGVLLHITADARRPRVERGAHGPWPGAWSHRLVLAGFAVVVEPPPVDAPTDAVWLDPTGPGLAAAHEVAAASRRRLDDLRHGVQCSRAFWRSRAVVVHATTPPWGGERVARVH